MLSDMPKKRGDRAHRTAEKRARWQRRQLAQEERIWEDHARLVVERSQDPRFIQRIHREDGSTVYRWSTDCKHSASWHGRSAGWASGGVRCGGWGQVGVGSAGIQGLPVSASRRTVMASWPCLMAVET